MAGNLDTTPYLNLRYGVVFSVQRIPISDSRLPPSRYVGMKWEPAAEWLSAAGRVYR
jgi:hypothetical protein